MYIVCVFSGIPGIQQKFRIKISNYKTINRKGKFSSNPQINPLWLYNQSSKVECCHILILHLVHICFKLNTVIQRNIFKILP